jgi:hypothetical protein
MRKDPDRLNSTYIVAVDVESVAWRGTKAAAIAMKSGRTAKARMVKALKKVNVEGKG